MRGPTAALAECIAALDGNRLPTPVRRLAEQHVLDVLAGLHAGLSVPEAAPVLDRFAGPGGGGTAVLGTDRRTAGPAGAAAAMAMLAHAAESDPIHAGTAVCAGAVTVPAALALIQEHAVPGAALLAAVVAGYELSIRLGMALGSARLLAEGWWPTAVCGGAGAAATAAKMLGLDAEGIRNALGLALVHAGGLSAGGAESPHARNLLCGNTARIGVEAALAARDGMIGPSEPLAGPRGFLGAFGAGGESAEALTLGLGERWAIAHTSLKAFPAALQAQSALEAVRSIVDAHELRAAAVRRVDIALAAPMVPIVNRPGPPATWLAAAASLQYQAAHLLLGREAIPGRAAGDDAVLGAMALIRVASAGDLDPRYPAEWPARVTVEATSGATYTAEVANPRGHPDRPIPMTETADRFARYAGVRLTPVSCRRVIETVQGLAEAPSTDALTDALLRSENDR